MRDWIEWPGGKCPVSAVAKIDIRFRFGLVRYEVIAGDFSDHDPDLDYWAHQNDGHDIIAYRTGYSA